MKSYRCKGCYWWDHEHKSLVEVAPDLGYCRKHKPIAVHREGKYYGSWPLVDASDFCGEFRLEEE